MKKKIFNLITFYILIMFPFFFLIRYMTRIPFLYGWFGVLALLAYAFIYRPYIDYLRLRSKGIINEPFRLGTALNYNYRYFKELFWI
jgi:hypothetical protein